MVRVELAGQGGQATDALLSPRPDHLGTGGRDLHQHPPGRPRGPGTARPGRPARSGGALHLLVTVGMLRVARRPFRPTFLQEILVTHPRIVSCVWFTHPAVCTVL